MGLSLMLAGVALTFFWSAGVRQRLQGSRADIVQAFAQLDQQLQARHQVLAEVLEAARKGWPSAHDATERVAAARMQLMAAADLVRARPATAGPIKTLDLAETSLNTALVGLAAWVDAVQVPVVLEAAQKLAPCGQRVRFAALACNQRLDQYNDAVQRLPTRWVAGLMRHRVLPVLTVFSHG